MLLWFPEKRHLIACNHEQLRDLVSFFKIDNSRVTKRTPSISSGFTSEKKSNGHSKNESVSDPLDGLEVADLFDDLIL